VRENMEEIEQGKKEKTFNKITFKEQRVINLLALYSSNVFRLKLFKKSCNMIRKQRLDYL
jgi:hypothetical protein